jgi:hypothetical protein
MDEKERATAASAVWWKEHSKRRDHTATSPTPLCCVQSKHNLAGVSLQVMNFSVPLRPTTLQAVHMFQLYLSPNTSMLRAVSTHRPHGYQALHLIVRVPYISQDVTVNVSTETLREILVYNFAFSVRC